MKRQHLLQLWDNKYYFKRMCTPAWSQRLSYTFVLWILQALTALYSNIPRTEELNGFQKGSCCPKHKDDVDTYMNFCEVQLQRMKSLLFKNFADEKHAGFVGTLCKHRSSTSEDFANNVSLSPDLIFFFLPDCQVVRHFNTTGSVLQFVKWFKSAFSIEVDKTEDERILPQRRWSWPDMDKPYDQYK